MLLDQYEKLLGRNSEGGGLSIQSLAAWHFLFDCQKGFGISGSMIEIGVWHGVSLAAMRMHASVHETVHGFDIALQREELDKTFHSVLGSAVGISLREINSINLRKVGFGSGSYRFVHIDGEHSYNAVRYDLELAEMAICDGGIVVVDDFFNIQSACVTHAVFDALAARPFALRMFLAGGNKAYLSTPRFFAAYRKKALHDFVSFAEHEFAERIMLCQNSHGTEIDYVTFCSRYGDYEGMKIGQWLEEPPEF